MSTFVLPFLCAVALGSLLGFLFYFSALRRIGEKFRIGLTSPFALEKELLRTLQERDRAYRAAVGVDLEGGVNRNEMSGRLQNLVALAGEELRAKSVELSLFDSESGLTAQSFIVGVPSNAFSKGVLSDEELEKSFAVLREDRDGAKFLYRPVRFARKTWGVLQFEFLGKRQVAKADEELIGLYAQRIAIVLLDSQFTEELLRMHQLSEESIRAKTGFLANLSHELRGPLGIILNGAELALDGLCGPVSKQLESTLNMIKGNGEHLLELVNDVLDYARLEAGKIVAKPEEIPLKVLLDDLLRVAQGQAEQKKHKLILGAVDETLGVRCDRRHIRQMLINFLTNAIKYTPDGGIITIAGTSLADGRVKISVEDTGVGIPENQRSKVFGAFERVEHSYSEKQAGAGLGMPLTRRLAEANGGFVDFISVPDKGSTFWLILPGSRISRNEKVKEANETREKLGRGERLLILDCDQHSREVLATFLTEQGYLVTELAQPRDILKVFREETVQAAIVDSGLEGMNVEEIVSALRAHPKGAGMPLVLTTPSAFAFDVENYLKLGIDRCFTKPLDLEEMAVGIRRLIDSSI